MFLRFAANFDNQLDKFHFIYILKYLFLTFNIMCNVMELVKAKLIPVNSRLLRQQKRHIDDSFSF